MNRSNINKGAMNIEDNVKSEEHEGLIKEDSFNDRRLSESSASEKINPVKDLPQNSKVQDMKLDISHSKSKSMAKKIKLPRYTEKQSEKFFSSSMDERDFKKASEIKNMYNI